MYFTFYLRTPLLTLYHSDAEDKPAGSINASEARQCGRCGGCLEGGQVAPMAEGEWLALLSLGLNPCRQHAALVGQPSSYCPNKDTAESERVHSD